MWNLTTKPFECRTRNTVHVIWSKEYIKSTYVGKTENIKRIKESLVDPKVNGNVGFSE